MNAPLSTQVVSSVKEFITYRLLKDAAAYSNKTVNLYNYSDQRVAGKYVYGSPYAGWAHSMGLSGVVDCSGVHNPSFTPKGTGLYIDHRNGRVISSTAITGTISANVTVPDINCYVTTYSDYKLVNETQYLTLPTNKSATGYIQPYSYVASSLFFRVNKTMNKELSFGGQDWSIYNVRVTSLAKDNIHAAAIADIIRDSKGRVFPILDSAPLNEYGDLKSGWNYQSELTAPSQYAFINDSNFAFVDNDVVAKNNPSLEVGLGNIEVRIARNPRQESP